MAEKIATRHAYGETLAEIGAANPNIVVLDADVSTCTMSCMFGEKFPDRFYNMGIAEANMVCAAAGMTTAGLIPFVHSFAMFTAGRTFDQIRNSLAYPHLNVKVVGTHAGLTVGEDGATHQCMEDLGIMRAIPGMTVICPCDGNETRKAVHAIAEHTGPVYLRLGRLPLETVTDRPDYKFQIGKSATLREGTDATIIAVGIMVQVALDAAEELEKKNIRVRVLDMHTIKPLDEDAIINAVKETGAIVTAEEHNVLCGLGSAVAEVVTSKAPAPVLKVGMEDTFGKSGNAEKLLEKFGFTKEAIISKVEAAISMK
jgi:transketolase